MIPEERHAQMVAELKAATREAHEAAQALTEARREAEAAIRRMLREGLSRLVESEVKRQVELLGQETRLAMDRAVARVGQQFDKLAKLYLEGDKKGDPSLPDLMAARRTLGIPEPGITPELREKMGWRKEKRRT